MILVAQGEHKSILGAAPPIGEPLGSKPLMRYHQRLLIFGRPPVIRITGGVHIPGGVATVPPTRCSAILAVRCGRAHAENRLGATRSSQRRAPRQGLKLIPAATARLNMLEDCGPPLWERGGSYLRRRQGAQPGKRLRRAL